MNEGDLNPIMYNLFYFIQIYTTSFEIMNFINTSTLQDQTATGIGWERKSL